MPTGAWTSLPYISKFLHMAQPRRVLDLGIGSGLNGALVRQYVDRGVRPWQTYVTGVEVHADYRNPLWQCYDEILIQNILNFLHMFKKRERYDFVMMTDVIEHFPSDLAEKLVSDLVPAATRKGGKVFITTPGHLNRFEQGAEFGNEHERHLDFFDASFFSKHGYIIINDGKQFEHNTSVIVAVKET